MLEKMDALWLSLRFTGARFVKQFKKDERGLSGVVVAVLLILVAVLAIVLLWDYLEEWITDLWDRITQADSQIS